MYFISTSYFVRNITIFYSSRNKDFFIYFKLFKDTLLYWRASIGAETCVLCNKRSLGQTENGWYGLFAAVYENTYWMIKVSIEDQKQFAIYGTAVCNEEVREVPYDEVMGTYSNCLQKGSMQSKDSLTSTFTAASLSSPKKGEKKKQQSGVRDQCQLYHNKPDPHCQPTRRPPSASSYRTSRGFYFVRIQVRVINHDFLQHSFQIYVQI